MRQEALLALELTIVTPDGIVYEGSAETVVLPGAEGELGVLPQHVRFLSPLKTGELVISPPARDDLYAALAGGFVSIDGDEIVVLADACELARDIDLARAERARERAERELASVEAKAEVETHRLALYDAALQRALVRIRVAERR